MANRMAGFNLQDPGVAAALGVTGGVGVTALLSKLPDLLRPTPEEAAQYAKQFAEAGMDKEAAIMIRYATED